MAACHGCETCKEDCPCFTSRQSSSTARSSPCPCSPSAGGSTPAAGGSFSLFAYRRGHDEVESLRRYRLPHVRLGEAIDWAIGRGADTVLIELDETEPFQPEVTHHLCNDPGCPGGC
jgi:hypothetical protein